MRVGRQRKYVTLSKSATETNDSDGFFEALSPAGWWCSIQPFTASAEGRTTTQLVTGRFRPDVTVDTRISYVDPRLTGTGPNGERELFVRGVQHLDEQGAELRLLCEEIAK